MKNIDLKLGMTLEEYMERKDEFPQFVPIEVPREKTAEIIGHLAAEGMHLCPDCELELVAEEKVRCSLCEMRKDMKPGEVRYFANDFYSSL